MGLSLNRRTFAVTSGAAALAAGTISRAVAQEATPVAGGPPALPPLPEGAVVVATGLFNPRYVAFLDDGTIYVTEAGVGGDETFPPASAAATPEGGAQATPISPEGTPAAPPEGGGTRGFTGQITKIAPDGTQSVAVSGLASYSSGVGPVGIAVQDGQVYFSIGGAAVEAGVAPIDGENGLFRLDPATDAITQIAEFNTYEVENNPDGQDVNCNIYEISTGDTDGRLTMNDAGGNVIYSIDPESGEFSLRAILPTLDVLTPDSGNPPRHAVPTAGDFNGGGAYFVALLNEGWPEDGPGVLQVAGDGDFATFKTITTGHTMITGLAFGPDGQLYISQLFDSLSPDAPPIGSVFRINTGDGTSEAVAEGLVMPHGIAFDGDGNLFVTVYTLMSGPGMPAGQLVRFDGIATPA